MKKQISLPILISIAMFILTQIFRFFGGILEDLFRNEINTTNWVISPKQLTILFISIMGIFFLVIVTIAIRRFGNQTYPKVNVKKPIVENLTKLQRFFRLDKYFTHFRITALSGLFVILIVWIDGLRFGFIFVHYVLISIATIDVLLQFFLATGDVRFTLHNTINQLLVYLGDQIQLSLFEVFGDYASRLRIKVVLFDPNEANFHVRYHYSMEGDPDLDLLVGKHQGVIGRVFNTGIPWVKVQYNPEELGFSDEQISKMPKNISWKMGFPLLCNHKPFGVLAIDCDREVEKYFLDKLKDFSHAITSGISISLSQFPSEEVQLACKHCGE
ncbi:MAG: hypothetical protein ACTSRS_22655 [Candidatus Helarchaeota archaeon]